MNNIHNINFEVNTINWPYSNDTIVTSGNNSGVGFSVSIDSANRMTVSIYNKLMSRKVIFQPLEVNSGGRFMLNLKFDIKTMSIELKAGDIKISTDREANGKSLKFQIESYIPRKINFPNLSDTQVEDESENFFLRTVNDLFKRYNNDDSYETLKIAGLLRLLLLDSPTLIDSINKKYRLKLEFKAQDVRIKFAQYKDKAPNIAASNSIIMGSEAMKSAPSKSRNAFIKLPFGGVGGEWSTVEDVILYCANKAGGVHYDQTPSNKPGQRNIIQIDKIISTESKLPTYHRMLHQITFVTLEAIQPLVQAVIDSARNELPANEPAV